MEGLEETAVEDFPLIRVDLDDCPLTRVNVEDGEMLTVSVEGVGAAMPGE